MLHRVICVNTSPSGSHYHITNLGLGDDRGYYARVSVEHALQQLRSSWGDRYFTVSPSTGVRAEVIEGGCEVCGQRPYVRTTADGIKDNNLSHLTFCRVA